jgi:predicted RNA-binding Zn ribbon-like protein
MDEHSREAPGDLETVRAFVNTLNIATGVEQLPTPAALAGWLRARELLGSGAQADRQAKAGAEAGGDPRADADANSDPRADADALERAIRLREALRDMLLTNNDGRPLDPASPAVVDEVAARARLRLRVSADGTTRLDAESGDVDGALGRLLVTVYRAMETGTWRRLKACRKDTCRWAFYDHSKNGSSHWCSMDACGSREKARSYRERHRSGTSA